MGNRQQHLDRNRQFRFPGLLLIATMCAIFSWIDLQLWKLWLAIFAGSVLGAWLGDYLSPDIDQETISGEEWAIIKVLGPIGWLIVAYGWPYATLFKHRDRRIFMSHAPITGTIVRWAYFTWLIPFAANYALSIKLSIALWVGVFCGLLITDLAHYYEDFIA